MKQTLLFMALALLLPLVGFAQSQQTKSKNCNVPKAAQIPEIVDIAEKIYPNTTIKLKHDATVSPEGILDMLKMDRHVSFAQEREKVGRFDTNILFKHYQQYYKGVKVKNGGYTIKTRCGDSSDKNRLELFTPNIFYNIDVDVEPTIREKNLVRILDVEEVRMSELIISDAYSDDFKLLWTTYIPGKIHTQLWIDAHSGKILHSVKGAANLTATTPTYGPQNLNDMAGSSTIMVTPDGVLRIFEGLNPTSPVNASQWTNNFTPTTNLSHWDTDATSLSRQTFYTANELIPHFQNIGASFTNLNIATSGSGGTTFNGSNSTTAFIEIGTLGGDPVSVWDGMAHEMGHAFIFDFLDYTIDASNRSLHEGIADVIGTYMEGLIQGFDWVIGDDEPGVEAAVNRDISDFACETSLSGADPHDRGLVMGHWYFSVAGGIVADDIPAIGLHTAFDLVIEALNNLNNRDAGYPEMRTETILAAELNFGLCSPEYQAVVNGWDKVCVPGTFDACPCDSYDPPSLSSQTISNVCPSIMVSLDPLHNGTIPQDADLIWSTDSDPSNGVQPILDGNVTLSGVYYAYYRNISPSTCFSPASDPVTVNIHSCCHITDNVNINTDTDFDTPLSYGGHIYVNSGATLTISSTLQMGSLKNIAVQSGGELIIEGDGVVGVCSGVSEWRGITVRPGGKLKMDGGKLYYAETGILAQNTSTVDLNNIVIWGRGSTTQEGFHLDGEINLTQAKDLVIFNYGYGIYAYNGNDYYNFEGGTLSNVSTGVYLYNSPSRLAELNISAKDNGVNLYSSSGSLIEDNNIYPRKIGVNVGSSHSVGIKGNVIGTDSRPAFDGVYMTFSSFSTISDHNRIRASNRGVYAAFSDVTIDANEINAKWGGLGGIFIYSGNGNQIKNNYIDAPGVKYGIEMVSCSGSEVENNDIMRFSFTGFRVAAIRSLSCNNQTIANNYTYSPTGSSTGIIAQNTAGNVYDCNIVNGGHEGLGIYFNSMGHEIKGNSFDSQNDLWIRSAIGPQDHTGNEFKNGVAKAELTPAELSQSQFKVNSTIQFHMPSNPDPLSGWFTAEDNVFNHYTCSGSPGPNWEPFWRNQEVLCQHYNETVNAFGHDSPEYMVMVQAMARYRQSDRTFSLPDCITGDPVYPDCIDVLVGVEQDLQSLLSMNSRSLAQDLASEVESLSNAFDQGNEASALQAMKQRAEAANTDFNDQLVTYNGNLSQLEEALDRIDCVDPITGLGRSVLQELIDYLQLTDRSTFDYSNVIRYSQLCSDDYGAYVHVARALANEATNEHFDQYDDCRTDEAASRAIPKANNLSTLFPNPSTGLVSLNFDAETNATIEVRDIQGRVLLEKRVEQSTTQQLDLSKYSGIHFIHVTHDSGDVEVLKSVIVR